MPRGMYWASLLKDCKIKIENKKIIERIFLISPLLLLLRNENSQPLLIPENVLRMSLRPPVLTSLLRSPQIIPGETARALPLPWREGGRGRGAAANRAGRRSITPPQVLHHFGIPGPEHGKTVSLRARRPVFPFRPGPGIAGRCLSL